jgi:hypothetical protein
MATRYVISKESIDGVVYYAGRKTYKSGHSAKIWSSEIDKAMKWTDQTEAQEMAAGLGDCAVTAEPV